MLVHILISMQEMFCLLHSPGLLDSSVHSHRGPVSALSVRNGQEMNHTIQCGKCYNSMEWGLRTDA